MSEQLTVTIPAVMWKNSLQKVDAHAEEIKRLAAENEVLRKAGDAMYHTAQQDGTGLWLHKSFQDWRDAK